jgi:hypothetical protein
VAPRVEGNVQLAIVAVVLWRAAEIVTWYLKLLFDKGHRVLLEVERNLLFLIADSGAFVTVLAILLETGDPGHINKRWSEAFSAFLLNGSSDPESAWATAIGIIGPIGGIILLAAGLGLLIGIIGDRIRYDGNPRGLRSSPWDAIYRADASTTPMAETPQATLGGLTRRPADYPGGPGTTFPRRRSCAAGDQPRPRTC